MQGTWKRWRFSSHSRMDWKTFIYWHEIQISWVLTALFISQLLSTGAAASRRRKSLARTAEQNRHFMMLLSPTTKFQHIILLSGCALAVYLLRLASTGTTIHNVKGNQKTPLFPVLQLHHDEVTYIVMRRASVHYCARCTLFQLLKFSLASCSVPESPQRSETHTLSCVNTLVM